MEIKKNKKFYVIHFIYFSSMETDINFLLVLFPCLGADRLLPGGGGGGGVVILLGDHYKNLHWFGGVIFR